MSGTPDQIRNIRRRLGLADNPDPSTYMPNAQEQEEISRLMREIYDPEVQSEHRAAA